MYESDGEETCAAFNKDVKAIDNFLTVRRAQIQADNNSSYGNTEKPRKYTLKSKNKLKVEFSTTSRTLSTFELSELLETISKQNSCTDTVNINLETDCVLQKCQETMRKADEASSRSCRIIGSSNDILEQLKALSKI